MPVRLLKIAKNKIVVAIKSKRVGCFFIGKACGTKGKAYWKEKQAVRIILLYLPQRKTI